jgi:hypothetical protein
MDALDAVVPSGASIDAARQRCEARGARLCTSDEWYLACLCTYPEESPGGPHMSGNDLLAHRVRSEAALDDKGRRADAQRHVKRLLEGPPEAVVGAGGEVRFAGGHGPDSSSWMTDCRHRGLVSPTGPVGLRCCR